MPRLARTLARTAVIAGTATAVSGAVAGKQKQKAAAQQQAAQAAQAAAAPPITDETMAQLQKLGELKAAWVSSHEKFAAPKGKLING